MLSRLLKYLATTVLLCATGFTVPGATGQSPLPQVRRRSTHFQVRTDVAISQRLEREVLKVLETWHRRYMVMFESEPVGPIPVILYPRRSFHGSTGAPHWAEGIYDSQGAIHAAMGGVTRVSAELERLLAHELAHAFIINLAEGRAPRWLQEGLAQALTDHRPLSAPTYPVVPVASPALLDYAGTLGFTRHLLSLHDTAILRDVLADMGRGKSTDTAFRTHLGKTPEELLAIWSTQVARLALRTDLKARP